MKSGLHDIFVLALADHTTSQTIFKAFSEIAIPGIIQDFFRNLFEGLSRLVQGPFKFMKR